MSDARYFKAPALALLLLAAAGWVGATGCDLGQKPKPAVTAQSSLESDVARDFQLPHYDKENRLQSMLFGQKAKFLTNNLVELTVARLEVYDNAGGTNMIVETPFCVVNKATQDVNSNDRILIRTPDWRMTTEGQGFSWSKTNSEFTITNQVRSGFAGSLLHHQ